jgi:tRNA (guanine6-N2)-methyltransferase
MKYFALTTRGLEKCAEKEIKEKLADVRIREVSYRKIIFETDLGFEKLLDLKSVEDIFIFIEKLEDIGHTQSSLETLVRKILDLNYSEAKNFISTFRDLEHFSISSSSVGKRNYSYIQVKEALQNKLGQKLQLKFEDEKHEDFDLRVFLEHSEAYIGIRLSSTPLHRRIYKIETTEGSLKSNIAYCMCQLANITSSDTLLDPMCGSGTILAESYDFEPKEVIGGDNNPEAVKVTKKNLESLMPKINLWDARNLPFEENSIHCIVTNIPFGKQVEVLESIDSFYKSLLLEFSRILSPTGRLILLTNKAIELNNALKENPLFKVKETIEISLHGEIATIFCITNKANSNRR